MENFCRTWILSNGTGFEANGDGYEATGSGFEATGTKFEGIITTGSQYGKGSGIGAEFSSGADMGVKLFMMKSLMLRILI